MIVVGIVGPTSSGKSYIAHNLARTLRIVGVESEIISCDSMQVYKYFDIGTAKVPFEYRDEFVYHFIDILEPDEGRFSAGEFRKRFDEIVSRIFSEGKVGILVGGTGLYYKSVRIGIFEGPSANDEIRKNLYTVAQQKGAEFLYNQLSKIDKEYAKKISKNDLKRIVRALEVFEITGKPFSELHKIYTKPSPFEVYSYFILPDRRELYSTINSRVDEMLKIGLIDEVKFILKEYGRNIYPLSSIGYKEVVEYIDGKISFDGMVSLIKKNTRNFAKRQITLFKNTKVDRIIDIDKISYKMLDIVVNQIKNDVLIKLDK
ncbi:MAG: tRNA (adenosine(37)-N6)-dimethylallyltransferase MiaA [Brevinematia bacterium]